MLTKPEEASHLCDAAIESWSQSLAEAERIVADNGDTNTELMEWVSAMVKAKKDAQTAHVTYIRLENNGQPERSSSLSKLSSTDVTSWQRARCYHGLIAHT